MLPQGSGRKHSHENPKREVLSFFRTSVTLFEFQDTGSVSTARVKTPLNYDVMRQNVLDEIQHPQKEPRQTQLVKTHQIVRDVQTYQLFTFPDYKCYQLSPMPNHYLARLVSTPPDQLKQEERNLLHTWKNAIYQDVICTT